MFGRCRENAKAIEILNTMNSGKAVNWVRAVVLFLAAAPILWMNTATAAAGKEIATPGKAAAAAGEKPDNETCLGCHGSEELKMRGADGKMRPLHVVPDKFGKSVHGKRLCVECHRDITDIPHKAGVEHRVGCVQCHESLWETAKKENKTQENARLGVVVEQID